MPKKNINRLSPPPPPPPPREQCTVVFALIVTEAANSCLCVWRGWIGWGVASSACYHWQVILRLAVTLSSWIFTGEGTIGFMGCDSTEHRGQRLEQWPWLASWRRGACCMYGFSRDAQLQASVNTSCWHKSFVPYMMWWKSPMASHGRTLARTLCSREEL